MVSTNPNDIVTGKIFDREISDAKMYKKGWRSTTLVLRKPSGEEQVKFLIWNVSIVE
jgi:hypothetical protein